MKTRFLLLTATCLLAFGISRADEQILSFDDDITVKADNTLVVRENIRAFAEGQQIRHGIYRDFPTTYRDRWGNTVRVAFDVLEVLCDGQSSPYHYGSAPNGKRVYIGDKDRLVSHGPHLYTLVYRTNRQLGFFKDHDELFWNVTGNGWMFSITNSGALVHLPANIPPNQVALSGYTGHMGSREASLTTTTTPDGSFSFRATRVLRPNEGLTILLSWPKGYLTPPTQEEKFLELITDNRKTMILLGVFIFLLGYYGWAWMRVGRDPEPGAIIPLYYPPKDISPAELRYIEKMGYDQKVFTACVINMAVKGYLTISDSSGKYSFTKIDKDGREPLGREERAIYEKLFVGGHSLAVDQVNHTRFQMAINAGKSMLEIYYEKAYFQRNIKWFLGGVLLSLLGPALLAVFEPGVEAGAYIFMMTWLSILTLVVATFAVKGYQAWADVFRGGGFRAFGQAFLFTLIFLACLLAEVVAAGALMDMFSGPAIVVFVAITLTHFVFYYLLKAPTLEGRRMMDAFEGFKMYLMAAEADELKLKNPPEKTPQLFEKYLPYALALDVEHIWGVKFASILSAAAVGGSTYSPGWYHGSNWSSSNSGGWASSLGSSLSSSISSASTPPGSSGGGGGGSGGGGGGGGGGGW